MKVMMKGLKTIENRSGNIEDNSRYKHAPLWVEPIKKQKGAINRMTILGIVFLVIGVYLILDGSKK